MFAGRVPGADAMQISQVQDDDDAGAAQVIASEARPVAKPGAVFANADDSGVASKPRVSIREVVEILRAMPKPDEIEVYVPIELPEREGM